MSRNCRPQLLRGATDGLPDIVLIEDYGAQKYLQSFPGAFEPLSDKIDMALSRRTRLQLATVDWPESTRCLSTPASPASSTAPTTCRKPASTRRLCRTSPGTSSSRSARPSRKRPATAARHRLSTTSAHPHHAAVGGQVVLHARWHPDIAGNPTFKAALETYAKLLQSTGIYKPVAGWTEYTGAFTSGEPPRSIPACGSTGTIKASRPVRQVGRCPDPEALERRRRHATPPTSAVPAGTCLASLGGEGRGRSTSSTTSGARTSISTRRSSSTRAPSARCLAAREGRGLQGERRRSSAANRSGRTSPTGSLQVPAVNYGIFTNEVDSAISRRLPPSPRAASVDDAIAAIDAQVKQAIQ